MKRYELSIKYRIGEDNVEKQIVFDDYDIAYDAMRENFKDFTEKYNIKPKGKDITMLSESESHLDCWKNNKFRYFSDITIVRNTSDEIPMD